MLKKEGFVKFTYFYDGRTIEVSIDNPHSTAPEMVECFRSFLLAVGYHEETVKDVLNEEEYE